MTRPSYAQALACSDALAKLALFDPHVVGTPPLGIDLPESDIDIVCEAPAPPAFAAHLQAVFGDEAEFALRERPDLDAVIAGFTAHGWPFEIFGQNRPVAQQDGWRHFQIENRLLRIGGTRLRAAIMDLRHRGLKTEPAFASLLGLAGDPYAALLKLDSESDTCLRDRLIALSLVDAQE
ncbi:DUF4269 domain-containing protein [Sphingobium sp.]|uniref:DUF4269 domain-containing protein n=1 Tax=Sphingobium sp. TaxID=1912891 RepID=UPI002615A988|nr:DUF4269 domain-containing protein [Sphingobium sp.]